MFIKQIFIKNFKCFGENSKPIIFKIPDGKTPGSGLNIFVGENNSGKSTIFEAIKFFRDYSEKEFDLSQIQNKNSSNISDISVEVEFCGDILKMAQESSEKNFISFIEAEDNNQIIRAKRSKNDYETPKLDGKGKYEITVKNIALFNYEKGNYQNPSGIDADFKKFFELDFIWSDTNPTDITKFGSTTICGKLLSAIIRSFKESGEYETFSRVHNEVFNDPESSLNKDLGKIKKRTKEIFLNQFGFVDDIKFHFDEINADSIFKNTKIKIKQGKIETYLEENGTGMQRSIALALLQVYAENLIKNSKNEKLEKPFYLFIDEPEICLHPQAQMKLLSALKEISKNQQVFISTHSPYFIDPNSINNVFRLKNNGQDIESFSLENKSLQKQIQSERNFFFRHRDLFFVNKAIFVEGVSDCERIIKFCEKNNINIEPFIFYIMRGCGSAVFFKEFCNEYDISFYAIVDIDYLERIEGVKNQLMKIESFKKLKQENKDNRNEEKQWYLESFENIKEIYEKQRSELRKQNIFLSSKPDIKYFIGPLGDLVDSSDFDDFMNFLKDCAKTNF